MLADINAAMLREGRRNLVDAGIAGNVSIAQVDAENLPFARRQFRSRHDGVRPAQRDRQGRRAGRSIRRCLKPGGKALILEFSAPHEAIRPAYDAYSFKVLPTLGKLVAGDADSYRYLAESIRMHPDQETLQAMMTEAGLTRCRYHNLAAGIVALHVGYRV